MTELTPTIRHAGSHILSGAVIETRALDELIPDWKELGAPLNQEALSDSMRWLTPTKSFPMPHPPQMSNKGNYIISLSKLTRWMAEQAEELGVEIYPGFAGAQVLWTEDGKGVKGVVTNEIGLDKNYQPKDAFEPGMEFHAKVTLFAEGAHGSLSKKVISRLGLRDGKDVQTYGLGVKEVWKIKKENHNPGAIQHTLGWPLDNSTYGGTWLYHMEDEMVSLGIVVGLDYPNPYISPFKELQVRSSLRHLERLAANANAPSQRLKHHPLFAKVLEGGECIAYGARALNEGGYQSIPKLTFPGGGLIGCTAGFLNVPKIKGASSSSLRALLSLTYLCRNAHRDEVGHARRRSDLHRSRRPSRRRRRAHLPRRHLLLPNRLRQLVGRQGAQGGTQPPPELPQPSRQLGRHHLLGNRLDPPQGPRTLDVPPPQGGLRFDQARLVRLPLSFPRFLANPFVSRNSEFKPIEYPSPDGVLSFDLLTALSLSGTNHAENQPIHLAIKAADRKHHVEENVGEFAGLLGRVCPAGVYEYVDAEGAEADALGKKLVINSQNCVHCVSFFFAGALEDRGLIRWCVRRRRAVSRFLLRCGLSHRVPTLVLTSELRSQDIEWTVPEGGGGPKYSMT